MGYADHWYWGWVIAPLSIKLWASALFVVALTMFFIVLSKRNIFGVLFFLCLSFFSFNIFYLISSPSTEDLVSLYEKGKIDKRDFEVLLPYVIEADEEKARYEKEHIAGGKEGDSLKKAELKRRKEAEELVKKFKEEE